MLPHALSQAMLRLVKLPASIGSSFRHGLRNSSRLGLFFVGFFVALIPFFSVESPSRSD